MNDKIVPIKPPVPNMTGKVKCLSCRHEWIAVRPIGTVWHECPACTLSMGRTMGSIDYDEKDANMVWNCSCGNDLFYLTEKTAECPVCGLAHVKMRY